MAVFSRFSSGTRIPSTAPRPTSARCPRGSRRRTSGRPQFRAAPWAGVTAAFNRGRATAGCMPALNFLLKYRADLFTEVPIIYCSVPSDRVPKSPPGAEIAGIPGCRPVRPYFGTGVAPASEHAASGGGFREWIAGSFGARSLSARHERTRESRLVHHLERSFHGGVAQSGGAPS